MRILFVVLIIIALACLVPEFFWSEINFLWYTINIIDYARNGFVEVVWILVTLFFVDKIISRQEQKNEKNEEKTKIIRLNKVIWAELEKCLFQASCMALDAEKWPVKLGRWFDFNRLEHFFVSSFGIFDWGKKSYELFSESMWVIIETIRHALINIDFRYYPKIENLFIRYVEFMNQWDLVNAFTSYEYDKKCLEMMQKMIRDIPPWTIPEYKDYPSNLMCSFIRLYHVIDFHIEFSGEYNRLFDQIIYESS